MAEPIKGLKMPKILVIEDEPDQNKLIKLRLEARGYRVISVGKAKEGIDAAKKEKPDLILMDMILPDMHGLDATIKLKRSAETENIPIVAISAVGSPDFMKACLQEGILAYVRKPYDPRELYKTIEKYVRPEEGEKKAKGRPDAAEPPSFKAKLEDLEKEFKKKPALVPEEKEKRPEREAKKSQKIEEMLKGALSDFEIPLKKKPSLAAEIQKKPAGNEEKPKNILIIDDDVTFAKSILVCLQKHGYEVHIAPDGVSGLKQAFQKKPNLVLLNLILPAGGGETVLSNLRKSPETEHLPVFIMSSLLSPKKLEEKARQIGAQGFISKPVEPEDLLYIIDSVVGA
jgi:CheY-like chemotaxis protein